MFYVLFDRHLRMSYLKKVLKDYSFFFISIPLFALAHYGWYRLQFNEKYVSKEQRNRMFFNSVEKTDKSSEQ